MSKNAECIKRFLARNPGYMRLRRLKNKKLRLYQEAARRKREDFDFDENLLRVGAQIPQPEFGIAAERQTNTYMHNGLPSYGYHL